MTIDSYGLACTRLQDDQDVIVQGGLINANKKYRIEIHNVVNLPLLLRQRLLVQFEWGVSRGARERRYNSLETGGLDSFFRSWKASEFQVLGHHRYPEAHTGPSTTPWTWWKLCRSKDTQLSFGFHTPQQILADRLSTPLYPDYTTTPYICLSMYWVGGLQSLRKKDLSMFKSHTMREENRMIFGFARTWVLWTFSHEQITSDPSLYTCWNMFTLIFTLNSTASICHPTQPYRFRMW